MRRIGCLFLLTALAGAQSYEKRVVPVDPAARQNFERQPKIAVLVGVGAYQEGSGLSPLKYPAQDVAELAAELEKQGYAVRQLTDGQASRGLVVRTLTQIGQVLDPDQGTLLFYFSGHGFAEKGTNYLATYGVTVDDLDREGLSLDEVERLVKGSRAKRQVLWIDACRNDPGSGARDVSRRTFAQLNAAEGMRVLYSTRSGAVSFEDDSLKHGVFTYFLLRGLRGEAAGGDGLVTFHDLAGYVSDSVMNYGVKTGRIQRPFDAGEASGDFLLVKAGVTNVPAVPAPPTLPPAGPRPGDVKVDSKDGLKYVWIPPGKFMMGCSPGDSECDDDEKPAHEATITRGFWMGQTAVTVGAWRRYAQAAGKAMPPEKLGGWTLNAAAGNDSLPVVGVTWDEASGYCGWAGMRLPTEAEWELAARAGTTGARYGSLDEVAWYADNSGRQRIDSIAIWDTDRQNYIQRLRDNGSGPKPVGQKQPNAYGLYDMLGNVWQWTADWYGGKYYEASEKQNPAGPPGGTLRTLRGGSWYFNPRVVRVSRRVRNIPGGRGLNVGVRCVALLP
jgi:formylglycine-generating enzyme required for sulfatase activity